MMAKKRFQESIHAKGYNDLIGSERMESAFDAAMLHFQSAFPLASDMATAAANEWRRQGAAQFLDILKHLNITQEERRTPLPGVLYKE